MDNSRIYIVDESTGDKILLAKGSMVGWSLWKWRELALWLADHDLGAAVSGKRGRLSLYYEDDLRK